MIDDLKEMPLTAIFPHTICTRYCVVYILQVGVMVAAIHVCRQPIPEKYKEINESDIQKETSQSNCLLLSVDRACMRFIAPENVV